MESTIDKILNLSQNLLQNQSNILTIIFGITALLLACTWIYNFFIARRQVKSEIRRNISKVEKDLYKVIDKRIGELEDTVSNKLKNDLLSHEAEINRLFALTSERAELLYISTLWWADALQNYSKLGNDKLVRIATDQIRRNLKQDKVIAELNKSEMERIKERVDKNVPGILDKEKQEILDILKREINKK